jgi:hypothetical protein
MGHDFNMGMECDATPEWHAPFRFSEAWKERLPDSVRCLASFFDASGSRPMAGRWSVTRGNKGRGRATGRRQKQMAPGTWIQKPTKIRKTDPVWFCRLTKNRPVPYEIFKILKIFEIKNPNKLGFILRIVVKKNSNMCCIASYKNRGRYGGR